MHNCHTLIPTYVPFIHLLDLLTKIKAIFCIDLLSWYKILKMNFNVCFTNSQLQLYILCQFAILLHVIHRHRADTDLCKTIAFTKYNTYIIVHNLKNNQKETYMHKIIPTMQFQ